MKKIYKYATPPYMRELKKILEQGKPIYSLSIQTSGLDIQKDDILQIGIVKCHLDNGVLVSDDTFDTYVNPHHPISSETTNINGITNEMVADAPDIDAALEKAAGFMGREPIILGFNCDKFANPFLKYAGFETGNMIYPESTIDLFVMSYTFIQKNSNIKAYTYKAVSDYLECYDDGTFSRNALHTAKTYVNIFNKIYPSIPTGCEKAKILNVNYWEKSRNVRSLYVETDHGKFSINPVNGFAVEETKGIFDQIDIEMLLEYMLRTKEVDNVYELVKLYQ